jgi:hypothetical protein
MVVFGNVPYPYFTAHVKMAMQENAKRGYRIVTSAAVWSVAISFSDQLQARAGRCRESAVAMRESPDWIGPARSGLSAG